jgi:hypothetical protein
VEKPKPTLSVPDETLFKEAVPSAVFLAPDKLSVNACEPKAVLENPVLTYKESLPKDVLLSDKFILPLSKEFTLKTKSSASVVPKKFVPAIVPELPVKPHPSAIKEDLLIVVTVVPLPIGISSNPIGRSCGFPELSPILIEEAVIVFNLAFVTLSSASLAVVTFASNIFTVVTEFESSLIAVTSPSAIFAVVTLLSAIFTVVMFASTILAVVILASTIFAVVTLSSAKSAVTIVPSTILELSTELEANLTNVTEPFASKEAVIAPLAIFVAVTTPVPKLD